MKAKLFVRKATFLCMLDIPNVSLLVFIDSD